MLRSSRNRVMSCTTACQLAMAITTIARFTDVSILRRPRCPVPDRWRTRTRLSQCFIVGSKRVVNGQRGGEAHARIVVCWALCTPGVASLHNGARHGEAAGCAAAADHGRLETARPAIFGQPLRRAWTTAFTGSIDNPGVGCRRIWISFCAWTSGSSDPSRCWSTERT